MIHGDSPAGKSPSAIWNGLSYTEIPTHLLRAELHRRQQDEQPTCGTKGGKGHYNEPIHVFALFLILTLSTAACAFPIVVKRFPSVPVPHQFLFLSRHFGTGVLIATAFVHLLPTAFESLTDPCLPRFWNEGYSAMPGLIAMTAVFVVVGIEMIFASRGAGHVHATDYETLGHGDHGASPRPPHKRIHSYGRYSIGASEANGHLPAIVLHDIASSDNLMAGRSPSLASLMTLVSSHAKGRVARNSIDDDNDSDLDISPDELGPQDVGDSEDETRLLSRPDMRKQGRDSRDQSPESPEKTEAQNQKLLLQCLLLEAGILFHSVFIGMAFAIRFPAGSIRPWLMAMAYGTTTPIGQAIGLAIHTLYDPASQIGLLTVGFMNAISSGLLLFAGLVELLAEDFLSDESYVTLHGKRRLQACASVVSGAALMALVGAWA
ncbi:Zinc/iron permease [Setomelanomma holmii]|uniref:Zinc/iron permease n=1 Tax=Setomelanomma holmii TaxID=210430 RepID=A0A9P4LK80_9PLEO|nr:Zinc/iron permease [Setomelanomma holmii]